MIVKFITVFYWSPSYKILTTIFGMVYIYKIIIYLI